LKSGSDVTQEVLAVKALQQTNRNNNKSKIGLKMINKIKLLTATAVLLLLSACGGGGGGDAQVPSTASFNLLSAWQKIITSGYKKQFILSGNCNGTATYTLGPANSVVTFEGVEAKSADILMTATCASLAYNGQYFYDKDYMPLGYVIRLKDYAVFSGKKLLPTSVKVGDTGEIGYFEVYDNRFGGTQKILKTNSQYLTYSIEADTPTSVIFNLKITNSSSIYGLSYIEQDRYRLSSDNVLTPISMKIEYFGNSKGFLNYE
jgi:hypothetical protein